MNVCQIKPGRERSLLRRHPWVFASSVARGGASAGETVRVEDVEGRFLAWAAFSPTSQIRLRVWSFEEQARINAAFIQARLSAAVARRRALGFGASEAQSGWRVVHAEADGLPGLIVDYYAGVLVVQCLSCGTERWRDAILAGLRALFPQARLLERSDTETRTLEGLPPRRGWLNAQGELLALDETDGGVAADIAADVAPEAGADATSNTAAAPNARHTLHTLHTLHAPHAPHMQEHGLRYQLDLLGGQKTGFYLDQRDNRLLLRQLVQQQGLQRVLNCHCYSGGFSFNAWQGGARDVLGLDTSRPALALARQNAALNHCEVRFEQADVGERLRALREHGEQFDLVVLDPPKLAPTSAHAERAARAYKDMNRLALTLLAPGGWLMSFSCSSGIPPELLQKIIASAAVEAHREVSLERRLQAAPDHPVSLAFPEGEYLKGLLLRVQA